jgi:predicted MFS family arabinose efflux permease
LDKTQDRSQVTSVLVLAIGRLCINLTRRFHYPFLPEISRELQVPLVNVQSVVASQAVIGIASPLFGSLSEHYGRKRVLVVALSLLVFAALPGILFPHSFGIFYAVVVMWGFAKILYDPTMQAYVSDRVPYRRRALALGTTELSWAGSLIIAAPLTGYLLGFNGLRLVYVMILISSSIGVFLLGWLLSADHPTHKISGAVLPWSWWRVLLKNRSAVAALFFAFSVVVANEMLFIVYGEWMEKTFDLALTALGTVTIVIAAAEVTGEFGVIGLADHFGKRRMALLGTLVSSLGYALLPQLSSSLALAMVGIFVIFIAVEIAIVSTIPLFSEILPNARAVMMSSNVAAHSSGRFIGAFLGGIIYEAGGFGMVGLGAMLVGLTGFALMWLFIAEATHLKGSV